MPIGVKHFANTSNPFQKFLLVMLTEQSIGREFICSCVWLLLLPHLGVLSLGKCLFLLWPSQLGGSWRKHGNALNFSTCYAWFSPLSVPWSLCQPEMIRGSTGHFHVRSLLLLPGPRKKVIYLVSPAFRKKCFIVSVDVDLFCWASQVYYRVVGGMFSGLCHVDLYKE